MERREFGRRILGVASALGLRTVSVRHVLGLGLPASVLGGCGADDAAREPVAGAAPDGGVHGDAAFEPPPDATAVDTSTRVQSPRVILVGSGYGNAVTALRLTERGIPVTMLEMGRLWDTPAADGKVFCSLLSPDGRAMWFKKKTDAVIKAFGPINTRFDVPLAAGVLDIVGNDDMQVFCGRGVGGGSLVNLSIYVEPEREVLQRVFPDLDIDAMYSTYYPRARAGLRASQVPVDLVQNADCYQYSRAGIAAAEAAGITVERCWSGYDYGYMAQEIANKVPRSALAAEAAYGNNYGKRSLDKSYIADAMGTGLLTLVTLHQVLRIARDDDGDYVLACREIDADGTTIADKEMRCSHLFLGAGSMGTSELLVRARDSGALPDLKREVGTAWGPNSDIFVARDNPLWLPTGSLQATVPSSAFHARDQDGKTVFSMIIPFPIGIETYIALNIVMTENPEAGHFVYDPVSDTVELKWEIAQNEGAVRSTRFVFDKLNRATGASYNGTLFNGPAIGDRATYHPVGGCPLGRATDAYGRIPRYPGLYVTDGSLIPVGVGANPSLTITALAERNIERILAEDLANP